CPRCRCAFALLAIPRQPTPTLFPYTTLFRSPPKVRPEPLQHPLNQSTVRTARQLGLAQLHKPSTCVLRPLQTRKKRLFIVHVRRSEEHTSELQSRENLVCRLLLEKKNRMADR